MPTGSRESMAPDALGQVRRAFKNMFKRNKKPTKTSGLSASANDDAHAKSPSRVQTPRSAGRDAPEAHHEPSSTQGTNQSIIIDERKPSPVGEQDMPQTGLTPSSATRSEGPPPELSSSPKSPITATNAEKGHSVELESPIGAEEDKTDTVPKVRQSQDGQDEKDDSHEETPHVEHNPQLLHPNEGPLVKASQSPKQPLIFHTVRHTESTTEDSKATSIGPESVPRISAEENTTELQGPDSGTEPSCKSESIPAMNESLDSPSASQGDKPTQANASNRRAPAIYHDEKIPVMAEPPPVQPRAPAPGMVATSGPLEDFPFQ